MAGWSVAAARSRHHTGERNNLPDCVVDAPCHISDAQIIGMEHPSLGPPMALSDDG